MITCERLRTCFATGPRGGGVSRIAVSAEAGTTDAAKRAIDPGKADACTLPMLLRSFEPAVPELKTVEVALDLSQGGPPRELLFFDRFGISRGETFTELHFGFVGASDELVRSVVIVLSNQLLKESEQSFVEFISRFGGLPESEAVPRFRARPPSQVLMADVIGMAHHGAVGEIVFHTLSWKQALEDARGEKNEKPTAKTSFAGLLRCDIQVLKKWVLMIYDVSEDEN